MRIRFIDSPPSVMSILALARVSRLSRWIQNEGGGRESEKLKLDRVG